MKFKKFFSLVFIVTLIFFAGFGLGFYARRIAIRHKQSLSAKPIVYQRDAELLRDAFTDKMLENTKQINAPIENISQLEEKINEYYVDVSRFTTAYDELRIVNAKRSDDLLQVDYLLADKKYSAFAYFIPRIKRAMNGGSSSLIIPGSGKNQSTLIFEQKSNVHNYRELVAMLKQRSDIFILIKPNEDILAIHNGKNKLSQDFFITHLINVGGSYSVRYIIDSLAVTKYLKENYAGFAVLGVSQGGYASLLNALQSNPDCAVIASGYSVLNDDIEYAGFNQIIIPGILKHYNKEKIFSIVQNQKARYLFTYGRQESSTYRIEAEEKLTCHFFKKLVNVECSTFSGDHEYSMVLINDFLRNNFYKENIQ